MSDSEQDRREAGTEREIARRFERMRAMEAVSAPSFRRNTQPADAQRARPRPLTVRRALPRVAAAVALVALTAMLLREQPERDPAAIYADIMQGQQFETDSLLIVSDSVLPAMSTLPQLYEIDVEADAGAYTN